LDDFSAFVLCDLLTRRLLGRYHCSGPDNRDKTTKRLPTVATPLDDLNDELASHPQRVLVVAGTGVSLATDPSNSCAGWGGLLRHGVQWCRDRCPAIRRDWFDVVEGLLRLGKLVEAAGLVAGELRRMHDGEYARWLMESVGELKVGNDQLIRALLGWDVQIATTNYDSLIEHVSGRGAVTWRDPGLVTQFLRGDSADILHLHGHYHRADTVVLDARNYEDICRDEATQNALRTCLTSRTVVFVGCGAGLEDPNFGQLFEWSRQALAHSVYTHFRLVLESELAEVSDQCRGLPVLPIAYGAAHADLAPFLPPLENASAGGDSLLANSIC
jgi:hypothetical protein